MTAGIAAAQTPDPAQLSQQLDQFLSAKHTSAQPLAGLGDQFVSFGQQYGVDPRLVVAISGAESSFGAHVCTQSNAWNWFWQGPCPNSPFESWQSGAKTVSHYMHKSYLLKGYTTIPLIGARYCASGCEHWVPNVTQFFSDLGGNVSALSWPTTSTPTPAKRIPAPAQILAMLISHSAASQHWWQKTPASMTVQVQATVTGAMPRAGTVKLVQVATDGQHELATLHAEGSDDYGATMFSGQASLPHPTSGETRMQVIAAFTAAKVSVSSNPISLTVLPPSGSMLPWFIGLGGLVVLLSSLLVIFVAYKKRSDSVHPMARAA